MKQSRAFRSKFSNRVKSGLIKAHGVEKLINKIVQINDKFS